MPYFPRLHWPAYSPEATLPKTEFPVCPDGVYSPSLLQRVIFRLDRVLRKWQGIYEFCQADDCLLRVAITSARKRIALPGGCDVYPGDKILEIHWWNEHVARLVADRSALARAKLLILLVQNSFELLASYLAQAPEAKEIRFIHGDAILPMRGRGNDFGASVRKQFGFWVVPPQRRLLERLHDFFEEYLVRALLWAFHRRKARKRWRTLKRAGLWATRAEFLTRYRTSSAYAPASHRNLDRLDKIAASELYAHARRNVS